MNVNHASVCHSLLRIITHCENDSTPIEGLKCVYGPAGMIRVCKRDECEGDKDCGEKKRCVRTKWKGKMCQDVSTMCKFAKG